MCKAKVGMLSVGMTLAGAVLGTGVYYVFWTHIRIRELLVGQSEAQPRAFSVIDLAATCICIALMSVLALEVLKKAFTYGLSKSEACLSIVVASGLAGSAMFVPIIGWKITPVAFIYGAINGTALVLVYLVILVVRRLIRRYRGW